jgi:hypothetical protein
MAVVGGPPPYDRVEPINKEMSNPVYIELFCI